MKDDPGSAFTVKMARVRQLVDRGRIREAMALALQALEEEVRQLETSFQTLKEKMGLEWLQPSSPPQDRPATPAVKKLRILH